MLKWVYSVINWDGFDTSKLYQHIIADYEKEIKDYSYKKLIINNDEIVYVVQDVFVIYVGLINYGNSSFINYKIVFEELLDNTVFKFNYSKFSRKYSIDEREHIRYKRFHGVWGEPIFYRNKIFINSTLGLNDDILIPSKVEYVEKKLPELKLRDRYNQWEGYLYNFIIYELSDGVKTGYAIYCSENPKVHRTAREKANDLEWRAIYHYSYRNSNSKVVGTDRDYSRYHYETDCLMNGVNSDETMIDILVDKIEKHKANGWKDVSEKTKYVNKLCIAEHDLKYFWISKYVKNNVLDVGAEIFKDVHNGKYKDVERFEYLIPENKWKSEQLVYELTEKLYKRQNVLYQYRPFFLRSDKGQMSYDVFICGLNVAIEYQGKQHFEPVEIFGGEEHFKEQVNRDKLKKELSDLNGVSLIYINYWEDISTNLIREKVELALKERLDK